MVFVDLDRRGKRGRDPYQVAVFELHELLGTLVFVHRVVVGDNALAIHGSLGFCQNEASMPTRQRELTSAEHFETAWANRWMGRVFGCIVRDVCGWLASICYARGGRVEMGESDPRRCFADGRSQRAKVDSDIHCNCKSN